MKLILLLDDKDRATPLNAVLSFCAFSGKVVFHFFVQRMVGRPPHRGLGDHVKWMFACSWKRNCKLGAIYLYFTRHRRRSFIRPYIDCKHGLLPDDRRLGRCRPVQSHTRPDVNTQLDRGAVNNSTPRLTDDSESWLQDVAEKPRRNWHATKYKLCASKLVLRKINKITR